MNTLNRLRSTRGNAAIILLLLLVVVLAIIFVPIVAMWAIEGLFTAAGHPTVIPLTLGTWFKMLLVVMIFGGAKASASSK